jgi:hypothetical protein
MEEITPGIRHWSAVHPNLGMEVSSYWLPALRVLLDPLAVPAEVDGVDEILLSNRHHKRDAFAARERFGAALRVPRSGLHDFAGDDPVEPYDYGEPLAGGAITPYLVTELWPDDGVLHIPSLSALAVADAVVNDNLQIEFVPERYMDDPAAEKRGIRDGLTRLADELDFSHLLLAHGPPIPDVGRRQLHEFLAPPPVDAPPIDGGTAGA